MRKQRKYRGYGMIRGMRRAPVLGGEYRLRTLRQFEFGFQYIEGEKTLRLVVPLPGIDKDSLKVRTKADVVSISANIKEEFAKYSVRPVENWDILLDEEVLAESAKAKYADGVLIVDFEIANPPHNIEIS